MNWLGWLRNALTRRSRSAPRPVLTLYTRANCHLCSDAAQLLGDLQRLYDFEVLVVDIDTEQQLIEQYGDRVPVIAHEGLPKLWGRISPALARRLLRGMKCSLAKS